MINSVEGHTKIERNKKSAVTFISRPTHIIDSEEESSFSRVLAAVSGLKWIEIRARSDVRSDAV